MSFTKIKISFRSKQQEPLFMIVKECYDYDPYADKDSFFAKVIFQIN